jgi:hypothetical protein
MRIIERQMNDAIQHSLDWKCDNTQVITISDVSFVYLHGNLIAMIGEDWLQLDDGGHQTKTTKSRLNAILTAHGNGESIVQKDFKWYLKDTNGNMIPFASGMRLE